MRLFTLALTLLLAAPATATAQMMAPDSENGRYSSYPIADGMLRLDTRTGQMSWCSRNDAGWACTTIPDERVALEAEIARLQDQNAKLKKELLARGFRYRERLVRLSQSLKGRNSSCRVMPRSRRYFRSLRKFGVV